MVVAVLFRALAEVAVFETLTVAWLGRTVLVYHLYVSDVHGYDAKHDFLFLSHMNGHPVFLKLLLVSKFLSYSQMVVTLHFPLPLVVRVVLCDGRSKISAFVDSYGFSF